MYANLTLGTTFTLDMLPTEDGTYVARSYSTYDLQLIPVFEPDGFEVAYDAMNQDVAVPSLWVTPGDRIGVWTDPSTGIRHIDRTAHFRGPQDLAESIGREWQQKAIWDWADREVIYL